MLFGRLLNRAIFSHLLVAVPPAVVLGQMVVDINRSGLLLEAQHLHLALAIQLRDAIRAQVDASVVVVGHAERILDLSKLTIAARRDMLRALVADGRVPYLAMYRPDGRFDSLVQARGGPEVDRSDLPPDVLDRAKRQVWAGWTRPEQTMVVVAWRRGDDVLGYLATSVGLEPISKLCTDLVARFLVDGGRIDVMDAQGEIVLSSSADADLKSSAFGMVEMSGARELTGLELGITAAFAGPRGEAQVGALASAPDMGWLVAASRPQQVALASLNKVRTRAVLMSIIAALAAGLVGLIMARQVSGPVQQLVRAVRRSAQRGFSPDAKVRASGELGQLAAAFNHALAQMAEYRRQVRQTTQLRLRLSRFGGTGASARELLARASTAAPPGPPEAMAVLYADVVFDDPDTVDTEHLVTILGEFFSAAHEAIRQEGGWVDRYSGDAVIGLFVAAQLPAPERAALAAADAIASDARAISERWAALSPIRLHAAIGVVHGQARLVREEADADPTVYGDLVERAANLQRRAAKSVVLVDAAVATTVEPQLERAGGSGEAAFVWKAGA